MTEVPPRAGTARRKRFLAWGLACVALVFVARAVQIHDRCEDPSSQGTSGGRSPRVALSHEAGGCVLHRATGDVRLEAPECAKLRCEPGLASVAERARVLPLLALLVVYFAGTLAWAARFRVLVALAGVRIGVFSTWRLTLESQAGGIVLPGGVGGDALRVGFLVGRGGDLAKVIAAVLLDRLIGLSTVSGLAAVIAAASGAGGLGATGIILGLVPVGFVVGLLVARHPFVSNLPLFTRGPLAKIARPVLTYLGDPGAPRAIATALALSVLVSLTQLGVVRGIVSALGAVPLAERWIYLGTTMTFIVGAIPALPGGWGTSDAAFVFFFDKAGLAASTALAVSLVYRLFWYSSGGVGAVLYLLRQHASVARPSENTASDERTP